MSFETGLLFDSTACRFLFGEPAACFFMCITMGLNFSVASEGDTTKPLPWKEPKDDDRSSESTNHKTPCGRERLRQNCPNTWHIAEHSKVLLPQERYQQKQLFRAICDIHRRNDLLWELRAAYPADRKAEEKTLLLWQMPQRLVEQPSWPGEAKGGLLFQMPALR